MLDLTSPAPPPATDGTIDPDSLALLRAQQGLVAKRAAYLQYKQLLREEERARPRNFRRPE